MARSKALTLLTTTLLSGACLAGCRATSPPLPDPQAGDASPSAASQGETLAGLWAGALHFGPELKGTLVLSETPTGWRAELGDAQGDALWEGAEVRVSMPNDGGDFYGWRTPSGAIQGHWMQPATPTLGQRFLTPVTLFPEGEGEWRGEVHPLEDALTFQLLLTEDGALSPVASAGGEALRAYLRNSERNLDGLLRVSHLTRSADALTLHGRPFGAETSQSVAVGTLEPGLLDLTLTPFEVELDLLRVPAGSPSAFYPGGPDLAPYAYSAPLKLGDGWEVSTLEAQGLSEARISAFLSRLSQTLPQRPQDPDVHAVLIARGGQLVLEAYFHGYGREVTHDTRSASKSVTTALLGAAMEAGYPVSFEHNPFEALGAKDLLAADPRRAQMTLGHLASMTSGLACDDWDGDSPGGEDRMQNQGEEPDWYRYTLTLPMAHAPGAHPAYCSGGMNLVGGALAAQTGQPLGTLFHHLLAEPLNMGRYHLNLSPLGDPYMGGGIRWLPRDLLKLGQLMLDGGRWRGAQILSPEVAAELIRPRNPLGKEGEYALGWWTRRYETPEGPVDAFYAAGNGGQILMGFPDLDMVVLFLGGNYGNQGTFAAQRGFIPEDILPAVVGEAGARSP